MMANASLEKLLYYLQTIHRALRTGSFSEGSVQITRVQWMILRHVRREGGCTIGRLAEKLDVRPSTMSQMLDRLEKVNLVARIQSSEDSRVIIIQLTEAGEQTIHKIEGVWLSRLQEPFQQFTEAEQDHLIRLLGKLSDAISHGGEQVDH